MPLPYDSFLLVSFGGPERAPDVMPYLRRVTAGRGIPEERLAEVAGHYYAHGGVSPVNQRSRELLALLEPGLAEMALAPYWGTRNWDPALEDTVAAMRDDGREHALAFVTSAYGGYSSCRQYLEDIERARQRVGAGAPEIDKIRLFYNHPLWAAAWSESLRAALSEYAGAGPQGPAEVLFCAHSIPVVGARTSPYVEHITETARLVAAGAGVDDWHLVWQSRSGNPATPWLGPDICEVIEASESAGFVVVPIGFVCENLEITHDLDVEAAAVASRRGAAFVRTKAVSGGQHFVDMVLALLRERVQAPTPGPAGRPYLGEAGPWPDVCPDGHCPPPGRPPAQTAR